MHAFTNQNSSALSSETKCNTLCLAFATMTYYSIEIVWRRHLRELLGRNQRKNLQPRQSLHQLINQPPPLQRETQMRAFPNWEIGNMKNSSKRRAWSRVTCAH